MQTGAGMALLIISTPDEPNKPTRTGGRSRFDPVQPGMPHDAPPVDYYVMRKPFNRKPSFPPSNDEIERRVTAIKSAMRYQGVSMQLACKRICNVTTGRYRKWCKMLGVDPCELTGLKVAMPAEINVPSPKPTNQPVKFGRQLDVDAFNALAAG